ncbi:MAG: dihydrodipicolinate synthase family protein [Candidatus Puniceispirillales bacterium]
MIKGLISPVLTPFNADLSVAKDLYIDLAQKLLSTGGCAGLAPFGTTGEALSVGIDERIDALDALIDAGVDPSVMIPGTGLTNIVDTARLTRHAMDRGCHGAMILPAFYFKGVSDDGLYAYYSRLIEAVDHPQLKIYLYHIPQVSGVGLSPDLVARLHRDYPDIVVGIKDSSGDWENTSALLDIKTLITYPGAELPVIEAIRLGAPGCISATANLNGNGIAEVIDLCHAGKWDEAEKAHEKVRAIRLMFQDYAPIPAQKALLARATGDKRWNTLRPPMMAMDEKGVVALETALKEQFDFTV